jgi:hypothetical protein
VAEQPLDRQMRLAGIGGAEHRFYAGSETGHVSKDMAF